MTEKDVAVLARTLAPIVREHAEKTAQDALTRLAVLEAQIKAIGDLRDRVVTVETKAAMPVSDVSDTVDALHGRIGMLEARAANPSPADSALMEIRDRLTATDITKELSALRDRVVVVETKAAAPILPLPLDAGDDDLRERVLNLEAKAAGPSLSDMGVTELRSQLATVQAKVFEVSERVAVVETRPLLAGPQGEPGPSGANGVDGKDGTAGLSFEGVYQEGKSYEFGHLVTWAGSSWHCNESTMTKPGDGSKAWTLMVKRGRDGRDGVDATGALPVVSVGRR